MKNKEKYASEIIEIACSGNGAAVCKSTGKPIDCYDIECDECSLLGDKSCTKLRREWAESECVEKLVISKMDRSFLDYLRDRWKYMARDNISNAVYVFTEIPEKSEEVIDSVIGWHYEVIPTDALSKCEPFCYPMPLTDSYIKMNKMEVIGNMFDNPELLEEVK